MKDITLEMTVKVTKVVKCADEDTEAAIAKAIDPKNLRKEFGLDALPQVTKCKAFIKDEKPAKKTKKEKK